MSLPPPKWRRSVYDEKLHVFIMDDERPFTEAICTHTVPTKDIGDPVEDGTKCWDCLMVLGGWLADKHESQGVTFGRD